MSLLIATGTRFTADRASKPARDRDVSVIVVSFNTRDVLRRCLDALRVAIDGLNAEVFVVDNASHDGSPEMVATTFPEIRLIASSRNEGFGRANNRALRLASGRYVLALNPDTVPTPTAVSELLACADANPHAAVVGPRLVNADGTLQHSAFRFPDLKQAFFGFFDFIPLDSQLNGRYDPRRYDRPFAGQHLLGACLLIRRDALFVVGGFDPRFFMYFEETDLCARMIAHGWQVLYTPAASVVHIGRASTSASSEPMSVEFHRSQAIFYRKHYGLPGWAALKLVVWIGTAYRLARSVRAVLRSRIATKLFRERLSGYWAILWA